MGAEKSVPFMRESNNMKRISEKMVYKGQWLSVHESVYETKKGEFITWESIRRTKSATGVVVLAQLIPSKRIVLIKQFRPAAQGYVLGLPAGLAFGDPNHALVELKEETGYTGKIVAVSPVLKTGSTITNENGIIVSIQIDEHDPLNQNPEQELEPGEDIEVCLVAKEGAVDFIKSEQAQGTHISSSLWYMFGVVL
jgi:8-oxo-dGTP pyrophosphatase MutT (NUDIX family)